MLEKELKAYLKRILEGHRGRAKAITARELAQHAGSNERGVRLIIRELIAEGLPVASATERPAGYFIVETWQEAAEYAEQIKGRLIEDNIRRVDFKRSVDLYLKRAEQARLL